MFKIRKTKMIVKNTNCFPSDFFQESEQVTPKSYNKKLSSNELVNKIQLIQHNDENLNASNLLNHVDQNSLNSKSKRQIYDLDQILDEKGNRPSLENKPDDWGQNQAKNSCIQHLKQSNLTNETLESYPLHATTTFSSQNIGLNYRSLSMGLIHANSASKINFIDTDQTNRTIFPPISPKNNFPILSNSRLPLIINSLTNVESHTDKSNISSISKNSMINTLRKPQMIYQYHSNSNNQCTANKSNNEDNDSLKTQTPIKNLLAHVFLKANGQSDSHKRFIDLEDHAFPSQNSMTTSENIHNKNGMDKLKGYAMLKKNLLKLDYAQESKNNNLISENSRNLGINYYSQSPKNNSIAAQTTFGIPMIKHVDLGGQSVTERYDINSSMNSFKYCEDVRSIREMSLKNEAKLILLNNESSNDEFSSKQKHNEYGFEKITDFSNFNSSNEQVGPEISQGFDHQVNQGTYHKISQGIDQRFNQEIGRMISQPIDEGTKKGTKVLNVDISKQKIPKESMKKRVGNRIRLQLNMAKVYKNSKSGSTSNNSFQNAGNDIFSTPRVSFNRVICNLTAINNLNEDEMIKNGSIVSQKHIDNSNSDVNLTRKLNISPENQKDNKGGSSDIQRQRMDSYNSNPEDEKNIEDKGHNNSLDEYSNNQIDKANYKNRHNINEYFQMKNDTRCQTHQNKSQNCYVNPPNDHQEGKSLPHSMEYSKYGVNFHMFDNMAKGNNNTNASNPKDPRDNNNSSSSRLRNSIRSSIGDILKSNNVREGNTVMKNNAPKLQPITPFNPIKILNTGSPLNNQNFANTKNDLLMPFFKPTPFDKNLSYNSCKLQSESSKCELENQLLSLQQSFSPSNSSKQANSLEKNSSLSKVISVIPSTQAISQKNLNLLSPKHSMPKVLKEANVEIVKFSPNNFFQNNFKKPCNEIIILANDSKQTQQKLYSPEQIPNNQDLGIHPEQLEFENKIGERNQTSKALGLSSAKSQVIRLDYEKGIVDTILKKNCASESKDIKRSTPTHKEFFIGNLSDQKGSIQKELKNINTSKVSLIKLDSNDQISIQNKASSTINNLSPQYSEKASNINVSKEDPVTQNRLGSLKAKAGLNLADFSFNKDFIDLSYIETSNSKVSSLEVTTKCVHTKHNTTLNAEKKNHKTNTIINVTNSKPLKNTKVPLIDSKMSLFQELDKDIEPIDNTHDTKSHFSGPMLFKEAKQINHEISRSELKKIERKSTKDINNLENKVILNGMLNKKEKKYALPNKKGIVVLKNKGKESAASIITNQYHNSKNTTRTHDSMTNESEITIKEIMNSTEEDEKLLLKKTCDFARSTDANHTIF